MPVVMTMAPVIVTPSIVMVTMRRPVSTGTVPIPLMPLMAMIPIAIGITHINVTKVDSNAGCRYGTGNGNRSTRQTNDDNSAFE